MHFLSSRPLDDVLGSRIHQNPSTSNIEPSHITHFKNISNKEILEEIVLMFFKNYKLIRLLSSFCIQEFLVESCSLRLLLKLTFMRSTLHSDLSPFMSAIFACTKLLLEKSLNKCIMTEAICINPWH